MFPKMVETMLKKTIIIIKLKIQVSMLKERVYFTCCNFSIYLKKNFLNIFARCVAEKKDNNELHFIHSSLHQQ